jgi:surface protein
MLKFNNKVLKVNDKWLNVGEAPSPSLSPYTIRLRYNDGIVPSFYKGTGVQVSQEPNIWDLTYVNSDWSSLLNSHTNLLEVLGANTTGITNMQGTFVNCASLISVPLFDTSNVTDMYFMFSGCESLQTVPLFNTSNVTNMGYMFNGCTSLTLIPLFDTVKVTYVELMFIGCIMVQSGALALYQQLSSIKPSPPHYGTFRECGSYTATGSVELAQIPSDWK